MAFDLSNPSMWGNIGNIGAGIAGMSQGNPANAGNPYFNQANDALKQIPNQAGQYLNPFIQQGQNSYNALNPQFNQMINDPASLINKFGAGYQQSPGYQYQVDQATKAANKAAAAGGMLGSPAEQVELARNVNGIANQDFQQYLQNALGVYRGGLQGLGNFQQQGFGASMGLGDMITKALQGQSQNSMNQGAYNMQGAMNQQEQQGAGLGSLMGGLAGLAGMFF